VAPKGSCAGSLASSVMLLRWGKLSEAGPGGRQFDMGAVPPEGSRGTGDSCKKSKHGP
jgi:hypothetical protein